MNKTDSKQIPDGWKETTLGALVTFQRGHDLPRSKMVDGSFPIMGSNGIIGFHNQSTTKAPGVTIGRSGNIGRAFLVKRDYWAHNTTLYSKQFHDSDPVFVYYLVKNLKFERFNSGSAVPSLNRNFIHPIQLNAPIIFEQKAIARVLSSLDDKIELLRKQNETLEAIAQTIFKEWFVNFNFPDKNGKSYKDSGGKMIDSELGPIPDGWRVEELSRIIDVKDGTHDSPRQSQTGFHLVTSKHIKNGVIDFENAYLISQLDFEQVNKRSKVDRFDILISMIGTVGMLHFVLDETINFAIKNIGLFKASQKEYIAEYLFLFLNSAYGREYISSRLAGTTQSYVTLGTLREIPVILPNSNVLNDIRGIAKPIFSKLYNNYQQIGNLASIRNTLLPKLMSGQVRVKGIGSS